MTASQISAKRISLKWKRAGRFLCAAALASSAALSAFATRDANADFTLTYVGQPFVVGYNGLFGDDTTCDLGGKIELQVTFSGKYGQYYDTPSGNKVKSDVLDIAKDCWGPQAIAFHARVNGVSYDVSYNDMPSCNDDMPSYDARLGYIRREVISDQKGVNGWKISSESIPHSDNFPSFQTQYDITDGHKAYDIYTVTVSKDKYAYGCNVGAPGTWTISGDVDGGDNGGGDNGSGDNNGGDSTTDPNLGVDPDKCSPCDGNPIYPATGNKYQVETDYQGPAYTGIELIRYYNSQDSRTSQFGANWRSTWDRALEFPDDKTVKVIRANGRVYSFTQSGNGWNAAPGVTFTLSGSAANGWTLVDDNDNTEIYSAKGRLKKVTTRAGEVTELQYDSADKLSGVRGPYSHQLAFHHDSNGFVDSVTLPSGKEIKYQVDGNKNLAFITFADGATQKYLYNESANTSGADLPHALTGIIDGNGSRFATWRYDAQNRGISSEHANGVEKVTIAYNADGSATVTDALGNTHGYNFTTNNNIVLPTAVTGAPVENIGAKAMAYDQYGFVATRTDYNGNVTQYTHSARGQELSRTEAAGTPFARTYTTQWHSKFNLPTQFTEPSGVPSVNRVTTWTYNDANGALLGKTVAAGGQSRSWTYSNHDEYGHPGKVTGPLGDVTTIAYSMGAPYRITNALGQSYGMTYDGAGRASSVCDPNNLCVTTTYTPFGAVETRSVNIQETQYEYDNAHGLSGITTPDGAHYTFQNDAAHQLAAVIDPLGNRMQLGRDLNGNVKSEQVFDTAGTLIRQRSHNYDAVNRLVQDIGVKSQTTTYGRDDNGDIVRATDPVGNVTTYGRDALRRVTSITSPDGGVTLIGYNADDSIAAITDAKNNQTQYSYDGLGNQTGENSPDRGKITRTFDAAGNVATETDGRGLTTTYGRDILGRVTVAQYSDGTSAKYTYDENGYDMYGKGRLTIVEDASGKTKFVHNPYGDIVRKEQELNGGVTLSTSNTYFETKGQLEHTVLPSGKVVEYTYNDKSGKKETIKVNGQQIIGGIEYEPFSDAPKLWSQGDGSVLYHERDRDQDGNLTQIVFGDTSANDNWGGQRILYSYDKAGRALCTNNNDYQDICNEYDGNSRLTGFKTQVPGITDGVYAYDLNGNRTWSTDALGDRDNHISPFNNQLETVKSGSTTQTLIYDQGGNLTQDGKFVYVTDARDKYAQVSGGGVDVRYSYNGLGERVKKEGSSGAALFVQDGYQVMGEYTVTGAPVQETVYLDGLPVGVIKPSGLYYVNPDPLGSPLAITNTAGTLVWSWEHAPFGDTLPNENPKGAGTFSYNLRFPGQYFDSETGAHYNNARTYLPKLGLYQQPDPIGLKGGINPYVYVGGNPANTVDVNGKFAWLPFVVVFLAYELTTQPANAPGPSDITYPEQPLQPAINALTAASFFVGGGQCAAAKGEAQVAKEIGILRDAAKGKGNFGLGSASKSEADALGKSWVGEGYKTASDGKTLISQDRLRQFRPPSVKPNSAYAPTGTQANFEQRWVPEIRWQSNGHLDIIP